MYVINISPSVHPVEPIGINVDDMIGIKQQQEIGTIFCQRHQFSAICTKVNPGSVIQRPRNFTENTSNDFWRPVR